MTHDPSGDAAPSCRRTLFSCTPVLRCSAVAAVLASLSVWTHSSAATHTVTSLADSGAGSLRAAIAAAAADDVIEFEPSLFLGALPQTIALTSGELVISRSLTIVGPGDATASGAPMLAISGQGASRVLRVVGAGAPAGVVISGLAITDGRAVDGAGLLVENATVTLSRCDVLDNTATHHGGGVLVSGNGSLVVDGCVFARNRASDDGGGLALEGATLTARRSLIESNNAGDTGGGIYNLHGSFLLENCTITGNTAGHVAGIYVLGNGYTNCDGVLRACTVACNDADAGTGGILAEGRKTTVRLAGTIVAKNVLTPPRKSSTASDLAKSSYGSFVSNDYNLIRYPGSSGFPAAAHDKVGSSYDPKLASLAGNGGRTATHALLSGSPALNWIPASFYSGGPNTDQRGDGYPRVAGTGMVKADIGAFESQPPQVAANPAEVTAECAGASTPVELKFHVVDLDGDVSSVVIKNSQGTVVWSAPGPVHIPAGIDGVDFTATVAVPHTAVNGATFNVVASDAIYTNSAAVLVTLVDTVAPVVTLNGPASVTLECGMPWTDPGATAVDVCDGALPVARQPSAFTPNHLGIYTLTYAATDAAGNSASAQRVVTVVDTTPPTLTLLTADLNWDATNPEECGVRAGAEAFSAVVSVADLCDPAPIVAFKLLGSGGYEVLEDQHLFPVGTTTVYAFARDMSNNSAGPVAIAVHVADKTPPTLVVTTGTVTIKTDAGPCSDGTPAYEDIVVSVMDLCDPSPSVVFTILGDEGGPWTSPPPLPLGASTVHVLARDAAGNAASADVPVLVVPDLSLVPAAIPAAIDPATSLADVDLPTIIGIASECVLDVVVEAQLPGSEGFAPIPYGVVPFPSGVTNVKFKVYLPAPPAPPLLLAEGEFTITVAEQNIIWPLATPLVFAPTGTPHQSLALAQPIITSPGESRWFKFTVAPGSSIDVTLENLPANFDIIIYGDIQKAYEELAALVAGDADDQALGLLGTDFAPVRRSPEAYSPIARPEAYSPDAFAVAKKYSPEAYSPVSRPEAYSPDVYARPEAYSPEDLAARGIKAPEAYSPDRYSAAQQRSLIAFSAAPGTISEGIHFVTYTTGGVFYLRVQGQQSAYDPTQAADAMIVVDDALCDGVTPAPAGIPLSPAPFIPATTTSLMLWDSARIEGTAADKDALRDSLNTFAAAAHAAVIDLGTDARLQWLNAQADANSLCPYAKNLVAEEIRTLIKNIRAANPAAAIADITLIGNDDVIPFFRTDDRANIGNEELYFPPVQPTSQSQSSLRYNQVLAQDRYGSSTQLGLGSGTFDLPEIPVARLVETAAEVKDYLDAYLPLFTGAPAVPGLLPAPHSALVAAYDFMADSGAAIATELNAGLGTGGTLTTLIPTVADPLPWTADDWRAAFLGSRHDIAHLAAHFSTGTGLAADYLTRFRAAELEAVSDDLFKFALITSNGCHSGYNTVDKDAITGLTDQPDWAQAFSRKKAVWISGTGYQYGDTDFINYTERLLLEYVQTLRLGTGPVSIGQALVTAKRRYLAETPDMRGIDEKSLLQLTLYGLPMLKIDLPGARLSSPPSLSPVVSAVVAAAGGTPGAAHLLKTALLDVDTMLPANPVEETLEVVGTSSTIKAYYYVGPDGTFALPGEPIRPLQSLNVQYAPAGFVRGIGFRGGDYTDVDGFRPYTGAPGTELATTHGRFDSPAFFPVKPWTLNQIGLLTQPDGYSILHIGATQFRSDLTDPTSDLGTERKFSRMKFTVFYCPEVSTAALANAPSIKIVASSIDAGGQAHVSVQAVAPSGAGVHEVWICYTLVPDSVPNNGTWQSLSLQAPADPDGNGDWVGDLPAIPPADLPRVRFFVQAVNGFGVVSADTNIGNFFELGTSTLDGIGVASVPTTIAFQSPTPSSGNYDETVSVSARLTDANNSPLGSKTVTFKVGSAARSAVTNAVGVATASLKLNTPPAVGTLQVTFAGDATYANAVASQPFTVSKQPTTLALASQAAGPDASHIFATLVAADGTKLKERTVIFLADDGTTTTPIAEITDGDGVARLAPDALPIGDYDVSVYFAQTVHLPGGDVALVDPQYGPSSDSDTFTIEAGSLTLLLSSENVQVNYTDKKAAGASNANRGHSLTNIDGHLSLSDPGATHFDIVSSADAKRVRAHLRATLSGQELFDGDIELQVFPIFKRYWLGTAIIGGRSATVLINWLPSGKCDNMSITLTTPPKSGPLYQDSPAVLTCDLTLGTGTSEHPAKLSVAFGDAGRPWTRQQTNLRKRNVP